MSHKHNNIANESLLKVRGKGERIKSSIAPLFSILPLITNVLLYADACSMSARKTDEHG